MHQKNYAVAGVTGKVGSATAARLLATDHSVRALVRSSAAAEEWSSRGADTRIVDLGDAVALEAAITGCAGLFILLPFDLSADDPDAHADALALIDSNRRRGRGRSARRDALLKEGPTARQEPDPSPGLHRLEEALRATGIRLTAMRPGHFQEKISDALDTAQNEGVYPVFAASADVSHPLVATQDLGAVAADLSS